MFDFGCGAGLWDRAKVEQVVSPAFPVAHAWTTLKVHLYRLIIPPGFQVHMPRCVQTEITPSPLLGVSILMGLLPKRVSQF